jgi:micrococcal nuclease
MDESIVIDIVDGDTIKVKNNDNEVKRIRLACIDAPEISQSWGIQAKSFLKYIFKF